MHQVKPGTDVCAEQQLLGTAGRVFALGWFSQAVTALPLLAAAHGDGPWQGAGPPAPEKGSLVEGNHDPVLN